MSDNTTLPPGTGGDTIRTIDRGTQKTQVVALDLGGAGAEALVSGAIPVTGTFFQATQPVSGTVAVSNQPSDPATQTTLAAILARTPAYGSTTSANSSPVVLANDQTVPISQPLVSSTGTITTQNLVPAGTATTNSAVEITLNGANALTIQVTGTYTGALSLQATLDGSAWVTLGGVCLLNINTGGYLATVTSALQGIFQSDVGGMLKARLTALAAVTGTATVTMKASPGAASMLALDASIPAGTNAIGTVTLSANTPTLAAGTNLAADVGLQQRATTNNLTKARINSAATTNATLVKASAGRIASISVFNDSGAKVYFKLFNKASAPTPGTDTPVLTIPLAAGAGFDRDYTFGSYFATGIGYMITGAVADLDTTVIGTGVTGEIMWI